MFIASVLLVSLIGIIIFLEKLVLLIAKQKAKEDTKNLDRPDFIQLDSKKNGERL